ncbi:hypothetical protein Ami103574_07020 [Aminipila butyrica]|uniref:Uncharacterized protein n=1 Tax=Aminipila butyrica TaxID=433296 RepID=A0A858BYD5_9FIRM|nr:hypothetical protein [Aminipila butyrica]QIB69086.1 hypothetical protein Ami103574_07020 [Aminipila butyrica]
MNDATLKKIIAFGLRNKAEILALADYFEPEDIEDGCLKVPDYLVNVGLKERIMSIQALQEYLKDYTMLFQNGCIMLDLRLNLKQLGPVAAKYLFSIKDLRFSEEGTRIYASFQEDVSSLGNVMQSMALKAAISGGSALQRAIKLTKADFIFVDQHQLMIDLSRIEPVQKAAEFFELLYLDSAEGYLKFKFYYAGGEKG